MKLKPLKIGRRLVGEGHPCFIIAEIGSNHDQKLSQAKRLIDAAAAAGADAVKFQSLQFSELYPPGAPERMRRLYEQIKLDYGWYPELFAYARKRGVEPFSCPTSLESIAHLERQKVALYKIASPQTLAFPQLIDAVAATGKPAIFSTGYCDDARIARAARIFRRRGTPFAFLHCNSQYPAEPRVVGLRQMLALRDRHQAPAGFSDHTMGAHFASVAVALGACIIEKHLTLDRRLKGPDHGFAMEPGEFAEMTRQVRETELGLGLKKIVTPAERSLGRTMRMAVYAARDLRKGERLTPDTVRYLRSAKGVSAEDVFGRTLRLKRAVRAGRPVPTGALEPR